MVLVGWAVPSNKWSGDDARMRLTKQGNTGEAVQEPKK